VPITIETLQGEDALTEFVLFQDKVYEYRDARWPGGTALMLVLHTLMGDSPGAEGRTFHPLVARESGEIVARALACVDERYLKHWNENIGHIAMFEAMPDTRQATRKLMDAACAWLRDKGMEAARCGFGGGVTEMPFAIDDYETLPPVIARQNPAYYHGLLKDAGFESEHGWVDYKIKVTPELTERYQGALEAAKVSGYEIVPLGEVPEDRRAREFTHLWNDAFANHWGMSPFTEAEVQSLLEFLGPFGMYDTSVIAYAGGDPAGVLWVSPESTMLAQTKPGREIRDDEKLNFLGIGVADAYRGRGVNMAMASYAYLKLIEQGATYLSYTLVLDDNWPSRRTGEKLGGYVCANYMVYRRNFRAKPK
jgi:GNAT superfamily N-acetyltransferase